MEDDIDTPGGDLKEDLASAPKAGMHLDTKKIFLIALIGIGGFMAYVIFIKQKVATPAATANSSTTGGVATVLDPSAIGSLQTQIETEQQATNAQLTGIAKNADSAARDASGARTDASAANNGINDIIYGVLPNGQPLPNTAIRPAITPHPAPIQGGMPPNPMPAVHPPVVAGGTLYTTQHGPPVSSTVAHLQATGLAHPA